MCCAYVAWRLHPADRFGLISSTHDTVISTFFSFGNHYCLDPVPSLYRKLKGGLQRLADTLPIYMIPGKVHTHTGDKASFYDKTVNGVLLYKWVAQLLSKDAPRPRSVSPHNSQEE